MLSTEFNRNYNIYNCKQTFSEDAHANDYYMFSPPKEVDKVVVAMQHASCAPFNLEAVTSGSLLKLCKYVNGLN